MRMNIIFDITIHVYAEECLRDEILDWNVADVGLFSFDTLLPLRRNRRFKMLYQYEASDTLFDVAHAIIERADDVSLEERLLCETDVHFLSNGLRYSIEDETALFSPLVEKHLDPENTGEIAVELLLCMDAGCICREGNLRYYVNSHEQGRHNEPHIHVSDKQHEYDASISILTTDIFAGYLPPKLYREARKTIVAKHEFFLNAWNTLTDGLKIDINRALGHIAY